MLLSPSDSHHRRRGLHRREKINPALSPDCYCLLWFKLRDSGHFLCVAICLLPEGTAERKKEKVNLARKQGRSRVFSKQLTDLTSGSPSSIKLEIKCRQTQLIPRSGSSDKSAQQPWLVQHPALTPGMLQRHPALTPGMFLRVHQGS